MTSSIDFLLLLSYTINIIVGNHSVHVMIKSTPLHYCILSTAVKYFGAGSHSRIWIIPPSRPVAICLFMIAQIRPKRSFLLLGAQRRRHEVSQTLFSRPNPSHIFAIATRVEFFFDCFFRDFHFSIFTPPFVSPSLTGRL